jgi:DNA-binding MarR family transcriptional regulator
MFRVLYAKRNYCGNHAFPVTFAVKESALNPHDALGPPDDAGRWIVPELLIRFMRVSLELNRRASDHGDMPSPQQIRAVLFLVHNDGATIKSLAHALSVSEARASRLADELVELGHVVHERDPDDRRQVLLHVAPASAEKARRMYAERTGAVRAALAGASNEQLAVFSHYLQRIVEEFEALAVRAGESRADCSGESDEPPANVANA